MLLLRRLRLAAELLVEPMEEIVDALRCRDDVEGGRARSSLLEEADPEFAPRELPLHVRPFLRSAAGWVTGRERETKVVLVSGVLGVWCALLVHQSHAHAQRNTERS